MVEPNWEDFVNFSRGEFACRHCGRAEMNEDFMWRLQELRNSYGQPMRVTSGYRCRSIRRKHIARKAEG